MEHYQRILHRLYFSDNMSISKVLSKWKESSSIGEMSRKCEKVVVRKQAKSN